MLIGYVRISKGCGDQSLDLQYDALKKYGVAEDRIYQDIASGKNDDRPGLKECLKALQPGNTLVIFTLDRLGRSIKNLIDIVDRLNKDGINLKVLSGSGAHIDTSTPYGRMVFNIFATLAEFERELIVERTKAGLAAARARGKKGGRPRKMDKETLKIVMAAMSDKNTVVSQLAKKLGFSTVTIYKYVFADGKLREEGLKLMNS